ncbi:virulence-associated protein E [Streptococcus parasanguinis]|jgi:prophage ps2 protein 15|uniref:virulence-associated E family protein n=1 Tax=Streptococcus parasanguinis TaxID=1318 RepID=UPI0012BB503D|nr:virulence-associated E family protein [Streptococcus parasanguinis]MTS09715.1 virulence-associated protein E [Streptococcus parasanguinis]
MSVEKALEKTIQDERASPSLLNLTERRETENENNSLGLAEKAKGKGWASSLDNLSKIISGDSKLKEKLRYNEFTHEIDIIGSLKLNSDNGISGVADDSVLKEIRLYIAKKYKVDFKKSDISDTLEVVARTQGYNPLKNFLLECEREYNSCSDPPETFNILHQYLNVEDSKYNRIIFDLFFRGAVAKVFDPGVKFDFVLDLTGKQGVGKTQFFEGLFTDQYFTTVETFTDKDDKARMVRNWCVFDDEMVATKKTSFQELKRFITDRKIEYRPPYGSTDRRLLKNFVIVRATNQPDFLNDLTGERRFLVAEVYKDSSYRGRNWTENDRRRFWGGMVKAWRDNKDLTLSDEQEALVNAIRAKYKAIDEELEDLERYLNTPYPERMYFSPPTDKVRKYFIHEILNNGMWLNGNGEEEKLDEKYGKLVERDRLTVNLFFQEVYLNDSPTQKQKAKIRMALQNQQEWQYKKGIKFGKVTTSGFLKNG